LPKDKSANHEKIVEAAFREFMNYSFTDASMRRIASSCGMSVSGLYKHFSCKEDMFAALITPAYEGLIDKYFGVYQDELDNLDVSSVNDIWESSNESEYIISYIYDHFDAFKLLVCHSKGTRFENYIHDLAILEEENTLKFFEKMREQGISVTELPKREFHLFVTTNLTAIFQTVEHDFDRQEALSYSRHLDTFYVAGWKRLLDIK